MALSWITSYFKDRSQIVSFNHARSVEKFLTCEAPQGLVYGPLAFISYYAPIYDLIYTFNVRFMSYAYDVQIYDSFTQVNSAGTISSLENAISAL